jgi:hypothetical protein
MCGILETFPWDGLALLRRNNTLYIVEPHPSGGVPVASYQIGAPGTMTYFLNDMLGTTLATLEGGVIRYEKLTTFGEARRRVTTSPAAVLPNDGQPQNFVPTTESLPPVTH